MGVSRVPRRRAPPLQAGFSQLHWMRLVNSSDDLTEGVGVQDADAGDCRVIPMEEVRRAKEIHVYGTTPNITSVIELDGEPVGSGVPGEVAKRLYDLMRTEMLPQSALLTRVFELDDRR